MQSDKEYNLKERVYAVLLCLLQCADIDPANRIASRTHLFQVELTYSVRFLITLFIKLHPKSIKTFRIGLQITYRFSTDAPDIYVYCFSLENTLNIYIMTSSVILPAKTNYYYLSAIFENGESHCLYTCFITANFLAH